MNRTIFWSALFFAGGLGIAGAILVNPVEWSWAHAVQQRLGISMSRTTGAETAAAASPDAPERRILYWRAPMDPSYIRDKPGKSPMDMDLIPVYADEAARAPGLVEIDPVFVQNMGVRSATVVRTDIPHTIRTVGTFTYDEGQIHSINTKYEGWIENVRVNYVGQPVDAGEPLFDIFSPQLVSTQQEYLDAIAYAERLNADAFPEIAARARSLVEASRQRLAYWDIGPEQILELEATGRPLRTLTVSSPVSGLVLSKMDQALDGMMARPGMTLYEIVDLSTIWLEAEIFETDAPWLRTGQEAVIEVPHLGNEARRGTIRYLYPYLDRATRTLRISIELPNPSDQLRADMYANVTLDVSALEDVLAVPQEAVIRSGARNVVVVDLGNGTFHVRGVTPGGSANGLVEIRDGLSEGERVVVSSQFLIDSESNLREAIRKLTSDAPTPTDSAAETPAAEALR